MSPVPMLKQAPCHGQRTRPLDKTPAGNMAKQSWALPAAHWDQAAVTWPRQGWQKPGLPPAVLVMVDSSASSQRECLCWARLTSWRLKIAAQGLLQWQELLLLHAEQLQSSDSVSMSLWHSFSIQRCQLSYRTRGSCCGHGWSTASWLLDVQFS